MLNLTENSQEWRKSALVEPHKQQAQTISPKQSNQIIVQNLEQIINELELNVRDSGNRFTGSCPVHGGDSQKAFTIYKDDARWFCWSRHCEEDLDSNLISLICHLKEWKYHQVIKWLSQMKYDPTIQIEERQSKEYTHNETREEIRNGLVIPASFYLKKGFPPKLLNDYDVGYCSNPDHFMFGRVVFPIYDQSDKYVGSTGRTIYPISDKNPKWAHYQVKTSNYLYNLNKAYDHIAKNKSVVLVESCGNLLRLVQYGFLNGVCTFGAHLTRQQEIKIECTPAKKLVVLFDPDKAGEEATQRIIRKYGDKYDIVVPNILTKDVADSSYEEVLPLKEFI